MEIKDRDAKTVIEYDWRTGGLSVSTTYRLHLSQYTISKEFTDFKDFVKHLEETHGIVRKTGKGNNKGRKASNTKE